jgi:predicted flap endonuclease-1-like 5' DNA nuclease
MDTEFPDGIGRVAKRQLALNGFTRYQQLTEVTAKELLGIHGVGPKTVRILDEGLRQLGQSFAAPTARGR